jgi:hypothetical protein
MDGRGVGVAVRRLPAAAALVVAMAVLHRHGVPVRDLAGFCAYIAVGVTLPGTLLWRALRRRPAPLAEDIAAGTAVGYAAEVLTYIPARAVGAPLLVLAWPALTVAAFLLVPALRPCWRSGGEPVRGTSALAVVIGGVAVWSGPAFFASHPIDRPGAPHLDMPVHLARAAELKHHMPPMDATVLGEPLSYHWFTYADLAVASWVTGIAPQTLLYRLAALPWLAAFVVLIAAMAWRLTGRWWTGPLAVGVHCLALAPNPYAWTNGLISTGDLISGVLWLSPTQTFGAALFAAAMLLLIDVLRGPPGGPGRYGRWVLFTVLLAAVMGAKATYLPMLATGLLLVLAVTAAVRRRAHPPAAGALAITAGLLVLAQSVVFGGRSQGMAVAPFATMQRLVGAIQPQVSSPAPVLTLSIVTLLCWAFAWAGAAGLARGAGTLLDPPILVLIGVGLAGMAAVFLLGHPGASQLYFLRGASPYLAILAVCGLAAALPAGQRVTWRSAAVPPACWVAGAGIALLIRAADIGGLLVPYLGLLGAAGAAATVIVGAAIRGPLPRGLAPITALAVVSGLGLPVFWHRITHIAAPASRPAITAGAMAAGHWLRDHSAPDDVVATNAHCRRLSHRRRTCDNRHFWVAAYTERRVLVEGWGYTARSLSQVTDVHRQSLAFVPFWDRARLAANDAAFAAPSTRTVGRLRDAYGVRWLFVDETVGTRADALGRFARFRYRSGDCAVYQIPARPTSPSLIERPR